LLGKVYLEKWGFLRNLRNLRGFWSRHRKNIFKSSQQGIDAYDVENDAVKTSPAKFSS